MRRTIVEYLLICLLEITNARDFLNTIEQRYQVSNHVKVAHLISELARVKYATLRELWNLF